MHGEDNKQFVLKFVLRAAQRMRIAVAIGVCCSAAF
jgi:hypothetical protein